jgi:processive 1,2-diacylglycerol beta-glucosyltransferase
MSAARPVRATPTVGGAQPRTGGSLVQVPGSPRRLARRLRARVRAQRRWWRARWRREAPGEVLFPPDGRGMVAVETLVRGGGPGPRIAILHATAGSGHKRAAQALAAAFEGLEPGSHVREVDTLVFASRLYRRTYAASYNAMAARAPRLWGALYHSAALDPVHRGTAPVRLAMDRLNLRRLVRVVERENPDAVVCTHFLPVEALSPLRARGRLRVPLHCVITDFTAHPFWAFPHVDRYFVASSTVAGELVGHGVDPARIEVTGIPIDPKFAQPIGREAARARFGLDPARAFVLLMGGGSGVGPLADLAERLAGLPAGPQLIVVCGTNARLRDEIEDRPGGRTGRIRTLGFTHEVDVLLEACDLVVSKAGGLTCAEALVKRAPLVVFRPTPGQEVANAQYLVSHGAAALADTTDAVTGIVAAWLADDAARARVREAAGRLAAPEAALVIARRVLEDVRNAVAR